MRDSSPTKDETIKFLMDHIMKISGDHDPYRFITDTKMRNLVFRIMN